jgi:hypothetical protein
MRRFALWGFALFFISLVSCSGGGGGGGGTTQTPIPSIINLKIESTQENLGILKLTWDYPTEPFDGYVVQASVGEQPFENLFSGLLDKNAIGLNFTWPAQDIPELVQFKFRIAVSIRGQQGPFAEITYKRSIISPSVRAISENIDGVLLIISSNSKVAKQVQIERADSDGNHSTGNYYIHASPSFTSPSIFWTDSEVVQGKQYSYRCTLMSGSDFSTSSSSISPPVELLSVADFRAESLPSAVRLTWRNRNLSATVQSLMREGFDTEIPLLPDQQEFLDIVPLPGKYKYVLRTRNPASYARRESPKVETTASNPPGAPTVDQTPFSFSVDPNFVPTTVIPSGNGTWALSGRDFYGGDIHFKVSKSGGWEDLKPEGNPTLMEGGLFLRPDGSIGAVYSTPNPKFPSAGTFIYLSIFDGQAWKSEQILSLEQPPGYQFKSLVKMDNYGNPIILYMNTSPPGGPTLYVISKVKNSWTPTFGSTLSSSMGQKFGLAIDGDNNNWIWNGYESPYAIYRSLPNYYSEKFIPSASAQVIPTETIPIFLSDNQNLLHLLFDAVDGTHNSMYYLTFSKGSWSSLESVFPAEGGLNKRFLLVSRDGKRVCILMSTPVGLALFQRQANGSWKIFNISGQGYLVGAWMNSDNTFSAIQAIQDGKGGTTYRMLSEHL